MTVSSHVSARARARHGVSRNRSARLVDSLDMLLPFVVVEPRSVAVFVGELVVELVLVGTGRCAWAWRTEAGRLVVVEAGRA